MPYVLIVDDDRGFIQAGALMLRHDGFTVAAAESVRAARTSLAERLPQAMLLDWKLPDGTALDVLRWMHARRALVPTALVTGFWVDPDFVPMYDEARRLGASECVRRGVDLDEPTDIVRRLLDPLACLHSAVMRGDAAARQLLWGELRTRLVPALQARFRQVPSAMVSDAVTDACQAYLDRPKRFDPTRHVSIEWFVLGAARHYLLKAMRPEPPLPSDPIPLTGAQTDGSPAAKVALVVYSDFQCPYCGKFARETLPAIQRQYVRPGKVLLAFRQFPLPIHPFAEQAAEAAVCASRQGKFWPFHDDLFLNQQALDTASLHDRAARLGLQTTLFDVCLAGETTNIVHADHASGEGAGVVGTPTFLIGAVLDSGRVKVSKRFSGALPLAEFQSVLDPLIAAGTPVAIHHP